MGTMKRLVYWQWMHFMYTQTHLNRQTVFSSLSLKENNTLSNLPLADTQGK